jgi:hypothetical protein
VIVVSGGVGVWAWALAGTIQTNSAASSGNAPLAALPPRLMNKMLVQTDRVHAEPNGEGRDRTGDTTIFSRVLYQLSYLARAGGKASARGAGRTVAAAG